MNTVLLGVFYQLKANQTRVVVRYRSKYGTEFEIKGCVVDVSDDWVSLRHSVDTYNYRYVSPKDTVLEIRATSGKRRKTGMYYETYYRELPYVPTADGALDMTATLRGLLAVA
jgi:hypothetical protein